MRYFLNDTWCDDDTFTVLPEGATLLDDAAWSARHGAAVPYVAPAIKEVTMRQARELMIDLGILDTVNAAIAGMTGIAGKKAQNYWEKSQVVQRSNPLVSTMGALLGWDSEQLDAYFLAASKL